MNEYEYRAAIVQAFGGSGPIANERQFWDTLLTAVYGTETIANTEHEFWSKLAVGLADYTPALPEDQAVVEDGDTFPATGGTVTISVTGGVVSAEYTPD